MEQNLQKLVRDLTGMSRRSIGEALKQGEIKVNGRIAEIGQTVDTSRATIEFRGKKLDTNVVSKMYIMLNKPAGYLTSRRDPHNSRTIYKLLPRELENLFPVGRLDLDTEGLLLLTNDGDFTYQMTHPKFEIEKEYYVELNGPLHESQIKKIKDGIKTKDLNTGSIRIFKHKVSKGKSAFHLVISEGQKREIKRIFETLGLKVTYLQRVRMGNFTLGDLKLGMWQELNSDTINSII